MSAIAARVERVSFAYGTTSVFENINFHVHENELVTLIGPNGAGKTTLLKLLLGLLKPLSGSITVFGAEPGKFPERVGYVPQNLHVDTLFPISAGAVVGHGLLGTKLVRSRAERRALVADALGKVDARDLELRRFSDLSGGQRRRVLLARALVTEPGLLILDEPTANLDVESVNHFYKLVSAMKCGTSILLVTHDMTFVSDVVDRVLCLGDTMTESRNVHEHPLDRAVSLVSERYGGEAHLVRHDTESDKHACCDDCGKRSLE